MRTRSRAGGEAGRGTLPEGPARRGWVSGRLAGALLALVPLASSPAAAQLDEGSGVRTFSIPDTRAAAALAERARGHLAARRWSEALGDLQQLLDAHAGELLGAERPLRSQQPVHPGVEQWVLAQLLALPAEARATYLQRHEPRALAALERARANGDLKALLRIPRRWPITAAATRAWWTIGDLEFERGYRDEARLAWTRALASSLGQPGLSLAADGDGWELLDEHEREAGPLPDGVRRRLALARPQASAELEQPRVSELRLPGPGEGARGTPGPEASTWSRPYVLPDHPWPYSPISLFPTRSGDKVLVSTSMGLACVNAFSGAQQWYSGEAPGWERLGPGQRNEFFEGLDRNDALVSAAASDSIAVAALQVPISQHENQNFNQIPILVIIPDRRLFAFDLESGRPLWNHMPPPGWDGEFGSFSQRTRVAGPPVIQAGRIFVPVYRMQGRVDCHLACYELATGELIWSTQLVSGQRELNMFNRHQWEFAAPPVRIEKGRVLVLTQLGTLAAVDFFSGAILWETLYDQNPLPARTSYNAKKRDQTWRNAAPVVADGVVIATPVDSDDMIGVDIETGAMLWSMRQSYISDLADGRSKDVNLLLGADSKRVYLAGSRLVALEAPAGLRYEPPTRRAWRIDDDELRHDEGYARPILTADRIVVPTRTQRIEIDRFQGTRLRHPIPWGDGGSGNLLLGDGLLFTLDANTLNGHFEWSFLLERARLSAAAAPEDSRPALELAGLLSERGRTEREGGRTDRAREWLDEAAAVLVPFLGEDPRDSEPEVLARMHEVLRTRARVLADLADIGGALEALRSARGLAPTRQAARDCLLEKAVLLRQRDEAERLAVLGELEYVAGDLVVRCENVPYAADAIIERGFSRATPPVYGGLGPARRRLAPLLERAPRSELGLCELPVALWVALERTDIAAEARDPATELEELHRILELWPDEPLPGGEAGEVAGLRIADVLERFGRDAYAPFESQAQELLRAALESGEWSALDRIVERFPHSLASRTANDRLLDSAIERGEVGEVSAIVLGELSASYSPRAATERELGLLLRLSATLEAAGNTDYARELLRTLAAARPSEISPLPAHAGHSLRELAALLPPDPPAPAPPPRTFDGAFLASASFEGRHTPLGAIPPARGLDAQPAEVLLFARELNQRRSHATRSVSLVAFAADDPSVEYWSEELSPSQAPGIWNSRVAYAPGRAVIATRREVIALERTPERRGGAPHRAWTWPAYGDEVDSVTIASGVVLVVVRLPGSPYRLHALDIATGAELWRTDVHGTDFGFEPVCGSGKLAILPRTPHQRALIHDIFTGRRTLEIELPTLRPEDSQAAWIEDGRLIVPWFLQNRDPDRNQMLALDLETGKVAWRVSFQEVEGGRYLLSSILSWSGQTFLVLTRPSGYATEGPSKLIRDLKTPFGATARVSELAEGQIILGVEAKRRVQLDTPLLFLQSTSDGDRELRVHALQLPYGHQRWVQRVPIPRQDLYAAMQPAPGIGDARVALLFSRSSLRPSFQTELHCFDRLDGSPDGNQILEERLGRSSEITLLPLGDALLLAGQSTLQVMR